MALRESGWGETQTEQKKRIIYEKGLLQKYFDRLDKAEDDNNPTALTKEETIILSILEKE